MSFQKLTTDCLRKACSSLKTQLPASVQILNLINLQLKGKSLKETFKTEFYGIHGTDIINVTWTPSLELSKTIADTSVTYIPPPSKSSPLATNYKTVARAFKNLINWDRPHDFESIPNHFLPYLMHIIRAKGGDIKKNNSIVMLYLPEEVTSQLDTKRYEERTQGKFEIANLTGEHTKKMNSYWAYGYPGSEAFLAESIQTFGCAKGIFKKGMRNSEGLVSWGMLLQLGTLGNLFTLDEVRGHGLARWTFEECCRLAAVEHGLIPACEVEHSNAASRALMHKIGMAYSTDVHYVRYFPGKQ